MQEEYEVDEIINHRKRRGKDQFLVKWKNFPTSQATWQPIQNLLYLQQTPQYFDLLISQLATKKYTVRSYKQNITLPKDQLHFSQQIPSIKKKHIRKINKTIKTTKFQQKITQNYQINRFKFSSKHQTHQKHQKHQQHQKHSKHLANQTHQKYSKYSKYQAHQKHQTHQKHQPQHFYLQKYSPMQKKDKKNNKNQEKSERNRQKNKIESQESLNSEAFFERLQPQPQHDIFEFNEEISNDDLTTQNFEVEIKQMKQLQYLNEEIKEIVAMLRSDKGAIFFKVYFKSMTEGQDPISINLQHVKLLWPQKLIDYYISMLHKQESPITKAN